MKASDWARESRTLADALPGFRRIKFGFAQLDDWVAECILADTSAFSSEAFYLQAFALPRFVPADHLYYDYGFRIGDRWESLSPPLIDAVRESLPRLSRLASLDGLLFAATRSDVNVYSTEMRLCVGVLQAEAQLFASARERIERWSASHAWESDVLTRCEELIRAVDQGGFSSGAATLEQRRKHVDRLLV